MSKNMELSDIHLRPKCHLVMKLFEGPDSEKLVKELSRIFENSKRFKPEAVRKGSFETYFIGMSKKG